ncbi:uncharacterized protein LOC118257426 isoform X1 [Cygnus atratus]|uniref:uncharacterized protein LOC118257426 isoform X1 n=1 Tax=Cygnus atratus TaxID=8868 RepID=UPI0015D637E0|nr:uncharacterized protein LOC118257426 isoform X1 [Cygnus atratus]
MGEVLGTGTVPAACVPLWSRWHQRPAWADATPADHALKPKSKGGLEPACAGRCHVRQRWLRAPAGTEGAWEAFQGAQRGCRWGCQRCSGLNPVLLQLCKPEPIRAAPTVLVHGGGSGILLPSASPPSGTDIVPPSNISSLIKMMYLSKSSHSACDVTNNIETKCGLINSSHVAKQRRLPRALLTKLKYDPIEMLARRTPCLIPSALVGFVCLQAKAAGGFRLRTGLPG